MALRKIALQGEPCLTKVCRPVTEFNGRLHTLLDDLKDTLLDSGGVGLAAPQVGRNIRMLVMDPAGKDEDKQPRVLINPVLELSGEDVVSEQEGCLSVPLNYRADVPRKSRVLLKATDLDGNGIEEDLTDFPAIIIQHEADHLDGILFIDKISRLRRTLYDSKVKKWLKRKNAG